MSKGKKSTVVAVISIIGIAVAALGFSSYRKIRGRKKVNEDKKEEKPQVSVESGKTEVKVNDVYLGNNISGAMDLMKAVGETLLESKEKFAGREDFLENFVRLAWKYTVNPMWYERLPKNCEELEGILKKCKLYEKYREKIIEGIDRSNSASGNNISSSQVYSGSGPKKKKTFSTIRREENCNPA